MTLLLLKSQHCFHQRCTLIDVVIVDPMWMDLFHSKFVAFDATQDKEKTFTIDTLLINPPFNNWDIWMFT